MQLVDFVGASRHGAVDRIRRAREGERRYESEGEGGESEAAHGGLLGKVAFQELVERWRSESTSTSGRHPVGLA
jgi:hypothetical protein